MTTEPDLVAMCRADGVALRNSGHQTYYGRCPFHQDSRPSFQVKLNPRGFWTFRCWSTACGVYGGEKRYRQLTNRPPAEQPEAANPAQQGLKPVTPELCHRAAEHYNRQLLEHPEAVQYLSERGVDPAQAYRWGIGYAPRDSLYRELKPELDPEVISQCYLFHRQKPEDRQARRIIIPHWQCDGRGGWHTARAIDPDRERPYQSLPGRRPPLLSLRSPASSELVILVEGPFDLMACLSAGYDARCTAGNPHRRPLAQAIARLRAHRVGVLPDRDAAGELWAEAILAACRDARVPALPLRLPEPFKDPGETLVNPRGGPRAAIATAIRVARANPITKFKE